MELVHVAQHQDHPVASTDAEVGQAARDPGHLVGELVEGQRLPVVALHPPECAVGAVGVHGLEELGDDRLTLDLVAELLVVRSCHVLVDPLGVTDGRNGSGDGCHASRRGELENLTAWSSMLPAIVTTGVHS